MRTVKIPSNVAKALNLKILSSHKINVDTDSYNERRYGKPWIAIVTFDSPKGDYSFGDWVGHPGEDGQLVLKAETNDVVVIGQKDNRGKSDFEFYYVDDKGKLQDLANKKEAYTFYQKQLDSKPNIEELKREKTDLIKRLKEINKLLKST